MFFFFFSLLGKEKKIFLVFEVICQMHYIRTMFFIASCFWCTRGLLYSNLLSHTDWR